MCVLLKSCSTVRINAVIAQCGNPWPRLIDPTWTARAENSCHTESAELRRFSEHGTLKRLRKRLMRRESSDECRPNFDCKANQGPIYVFASSSLVHRQCRKELTSYRVVFLIWRRSVLALSAFVHVRLLSILRVPKSKASSNAESWRTLRIKQETKMRCAFELPERGMVRRH